MKKSGESRGCGRDQLGVMVQVLPGAAWRQVLIIVVPATQITAYCCPEATDSSISYRSTNARMPSSDVLLIIRLLGGRIGLGKFVPQAW